MRPGTVAVMLLLAVFLVPTVARSDDRIDIPTQPGVTVPILYDAVTRPSASVILFVGGDGKLLNQVDTFLLRVRYRFVLAGMSVAVPGTPSDHPGGFGPFFRTWMAHVDDVAAIVKFLKSKADVPVWVIGNSNGTISAANAAAALGPMVISGVILTSAVWLDALRSVPVEKIAAPVLIIQDAADTCPVSKPPLSQENMVRLKAAPRKKLIVLRGPNTPAPPCGLKSGHDFFETDTQATTLMIDWIKSNDRAMMRRE
jgi:pimeloyl-ACP methyl ester carboxylesterase